MQCLQYLAVMYTSALCLCQVQPVAPYALKFNFFILPYILQMCTLNVALFHLTIYSTVVPSNCCIILPYNLQKSL
jgi:hypothetical protein